MLFFAIFINGPFLNSYERSLY